LCLKFFKPKLKLLMMKKLLFVFAVAMCATASTFAQSESGVGRPTLSIGLEGGLPVGDFNKLFKLGIGGSVKGALPVATDLDLTLSAGYISFSGKSFPAGKLSAFNTIPIKAGVRYRFSGGPYVEPQLGYTRASMKDAGSDGAFTYAANVGYMFSPVLDLGVRYEAFSKNSSTTSFVGARLAYSFSL
jgi:hypothetical protein